MFEELKSLVFGDDEPASETSGSDAKALAAAALLAEAALIDGEMDERERERILFLLQRRMGLAPAAAGRLLAMADRRQEPIGELFPYTKVIVDRCDEQGRIDLIEMLWEVAYADGRLDEYEDTLLRRAAGLLYVSDQESHAARRRAMAGLGISGEPSALRPNTPRRMA